jgi:hypothetical protein
MNDITEHVVVMCLGMLLPRRSYVQGIFGLLCLTNVSLSFRNAMLARPIIRRYDHIPLIFTLWSQLVLL